MIFSLNERDVEIIFLLLETYYSNVKKNALHYKKNGYY